MAGEFLGELLGQADERVFGGGIGLDSSQLGCNPAPELIVTMRPQPARFIWGTAA